MAITINWATKVISIPQADLTFISGSLYELNLNDFRLTLKSLEAGVEGMAFLDTHTHNPPVTIAGTVLARVVEIINGYTITFEDLQYAVNLVGANSNVAEVANINQVSIRAFNTAGLIQAGTSLSALEQARLIRIEQILRNQTFVDQADGKLKVRSDDSLTTILESLIWEDAAGTIPYRGQGIEKRDRLEAP
jgi:hypothetical protein